MPHPAIRPTRAVNGAPQRCHAPARPTGERL
jgi:hypothetical protein